MTRKAKIEVYILIIAFSFIYLLVRQDEEMPADLSSMDVSGVVESLRLAAEVINQSGGKRA